MESLAKVLAIGNGESRRSINLDHFSDHITVGCNAICRDYNVDHLICVDRRMVKEALSLNRSKPIYTRKDWAPQFARFPSVLTVPELPYQGDKRSDEPFHWGSGPYAVLLGAMIGTQISMIGFDLWSETNTVNNIYKGTENYVKDNYRPVDPSYWIHQISKVMECFPDKYFIVYNKKHWAIPESWKLANVLIKDIDTLS